MSGKLERRFIAIDPIDVANLRLGLGWRVRSHADGGEIDGQRESNEFLNALVENLEDGLCQGLRRFDRRALIEMARRNHEAAMVRQATWRRTVPANLALHRDEEDVLATIAEQEFENNGVLQASRVLVEFAACECPLTGGLIPGEMDFSSLMAQLLLLTTLGDWSDAIYHGGIDGRISIKPLGDVHVDTSFFDNVAIPFGHLASGSILHASATDYAKNFESAEVVPTAEPAFEGAFVDAWREEKHATIDSYRRFVDDVENYGIQQNEPVVVLTRSELLGLYSGDDGAAETIAAALTTTPRSHWRKVPPHMVDKDRWPWRFRRRLSLLRRPIVQLDEGRDPLLAVAPGLVRDAVFYTIENYYRGYFPLWQLETVAMKAWVGAAAKHRGSRFSREVAGRLAELGWTVAPKSRSPRS